MISIPPGVDLSAFAVLKARRRALRFCSRCGLDRWEPQWEGLLGSTLKAFWASIRRRAVGWMKERDILLVLRGI
jgi:hypothetical protein